MVTDKIGRVEFVLLHSIFSLPPPHLQKQKEREREREREGEREIQDKPRPENLSVYCFAFR